MLKINLIQMCSKSDSSIFIIRLIVNDKRVKNFIVFTISIGLTNKLFFYLRLFLSLIYKI